MDRRDALKSSSLILGGLLSSTTIGLLQSCSTPPELGWTPQYFTDEEARVLAEIAEVIIPATDTPGAKEAGVARFVDEVVNSVFKTQERTEFKAGFDLFSQSVLTKYGNSFDVIESDKQIDAVKALMLEKDEFGSALKLLVVRGFFKSETGATNTLEFIDIPGRFEGCIPSKPEQKGYAT